MKYREIYKDIFTINKTYYLAHCIASDFYMGAGIAVRFQKKYSLRNKLKKSQLNTSVGSCVLIKKIFNLITKSRSCGKPTYKTLTSSLKEMKKIIILNNIKKIAMPKIGCGLDRLQWGFVKNIIIETFEDLDIEILVCKWK